MIALETLRNSLPQSEILSSQHPLVLDRSWGTEYWAELPQPGLERPRASMSMKNHVFPASEVLSKCGQCPGAPVSPARMVRGPRHFADAGGWWWNNRSGSFLGDFLPNLWCLYLWQKLNVVLYNPGSMETTQTQLIPISFASSKSGLWDSLGSQLR